MTVAAAALARAPRHESRATLLDLGDRHELRGAAWRRSPCPVRSATAAAAGLAIAVELYQALLSTGRTVDVDDMLLNVCGAAIGAVGYAVAARLASRSVLAVRPSSTRTSADDSSRDLSRPGPV